MEHKANIFGVALICVAVGSEALTLGRIRGAALVGQPLDVVVQVQLDPGEDAASSCFDADVFHADTQQDASRVRVVVEPTTPAHTANVRIQSSAVIDEPVVTVYLRTGCGQKTTRRYVLLADLPSEVAAPSLALPVAPLPAPARLLPASSDIAGALPVPSNSAPAVKATTRQVPRPAVKRNVANKQRPGPKAAAVSPKLPKSDDKNKTTRKVTQSRLNLDPMELLSDRVANLDTGMTAAASADALLNSQKMQALEADMKVLRALSVRNDATLVDLKARLLQAESDRFPGGWFYGLIALVLACLAAIALLLNRQRRMSAGSGDWWRGASATPVAVPLQPTPGPSPLTTPQALDEGSAPQMAPPAPSSRLGADSGPASELGISLMEMSESAFDDLVQSGVEHTANNKPARSPASARRPHTGPVLSLNSEATLDIRQQAEFFVSLGQTDRAVRTLATHIDESDMPNPLVYLDLLSLLHSLSLKPDFQRISKDFNQLFNGRVPEFAVFKNEGKGLESYPDVLARIMPCWATPAILEVLEACIFQDPRLAKTPVFDLAAFRDLLWLHDIALRMALDADSKISGLSGPTDYSVPQTLPPPELDLDLSDSEIARFTPYSKEATEVDIPLLMTGDHDSEAGRPDDATQSVDADPMLSFDLPEIEKPSGPTITKPRQPTDLG